MRWKNSNPILSKSELRALVRAAEILGDIEAQACFPWRDDAYIGLLAIEPIIQRSTPKVVILREYPPAR